MAKGRRGTELEIQKSMSVYINMLMMWDSTGILQPGSFKYKLEKRCSCAILLIQGAEI